MVEIIVLADHEPFARVDIVVDGEDRFVSWQGLDRLAVLKAKEAMLSALMFDEEYEIKVKLMSMWARLVGMIEREEERRGNKPEAPF